MVDIAPAVCPCCGGAVHAIGETVSEMLDYLPARLRVLRIRRSKYGCRACGTIHQAPAPERPIAKGLASAGLLAHVLVSKYCDHLPLYRQSQIFARQGITLNRSTLANWVGGASWWLDALHKRLAAHIFASGKLFADDTPIPVLDPGRGRTRTGRLWTYVRDDRPWAGPDPPAAIYFYSPDRKAERPAAHLSSFRGVLQVDGYAGFETLVGAKIALAACWAHARRKFYDVHQETESPVAAQALARIAEIYAIETEVRGRSADERQRVREARTALWSRRSRLGWRASSSGYHRAAAWPRLSAMHLCAGRRCAGSWTMAALSSTTTRSSGPSGRSLSGARIISSPARMAVPTAGP
jgi:transposase